ncbi:MAG: hypothetical protein OXC66_04675 [Roseovarius sp.]|nr:hypothetical protein [Roseovarius sp.]
MLRTLDGQLATALFGISEQAPKGKALTKTLPYPNRWEYLLMDKMDILAI